MNEQGKPWEDRGYDDTKFLADGRACGLMRLIFGGRICVGDPDDRFGYEEAYDYETYEEAEAGFWEWDSSVFPEPTMWVRHTPSYRRRPAGNPDREYVEQ